MEVTKNLCKFFSRFLLQKKMAKYLHFQSNLAPPTESESQGEEEKSRLEETRSLGRKEINFPSFHGKKSLDENRRGPLHKTLLFNCNLQAIFSIINVHLLVDLHLQQLEPYLWCPYTRPWARNGTPRKTPRSEVSGPWNLFKGFMPSDCTNFKTSVTVISR